MFEDDFEGQTESLIILLGIVAVFVLKFMGIITIPWIWLISPIWIGFGLMVLLTLVIVIRNIIEHIKRRKNK